MKKIKEKERLRAQELEEKMRLKAQKYEEKRQLVIERKQFLDMLHEHNSFLNKEVIEK